jgi:predicted acetyltransferase
MRHPIRFDRAGESDLPAVARLVSLAFAGPQDQSEQWLRGAGLENVRLLRRDDGSVPACLLRVPMGQFFGGRSVPAIGIAGVAVAPEARGDGLARLLMEEALREVASEGVPISILYASTQSLYRQVGFEQAGHRFRIRIPLSQIGLRERGGRIISLDDSHAPSVSRCYERFAREFNGTLDRGPYSWKRVCETRGDRYQGFAVEEASGELAGYLYLMQQRKPETGRHDVLLSDLAFTTPAAGRRLLGFLADMATIGDEAVFFGGPWHPVLALLPQQRYTVERRDYWMLRVLSVPRSLECRGYPKGIQTEAVFRVIDPLLPDNTGCWQATVADGRCRCVRVAGGGGREAADIRGLAAMYTGMMTANQATLCGFQGCADLSEFCTVLQGGCPWMSDMF